MIRLWISRDAALPIREQLSAQLLLGILSRKLAPGEKLPSVRDLARRQSIHGNTVLAVYRDLAKRGWVTSEPGRGVFVRQFPWPDTPQGHVTLDDLIRAWLSEAQALGYSLEDVQSALARHPQPSPSRRMLVVDSDPELARVLAAELTAAIGQTVASGSYETVAPGDCVLASSGQAEHVAHALGSTPFHLIHLKAMQDARRPATSVIPGAHRRGVPLALHSRLGGDATVFVGIRYGQRPVARPRGARLAGRPIHLPHHRHRLGLGARLPQSLATFGLPPDFRRVLTRSASACDSVRNCHNAPRLPGAFAVG